MDLETYLKGINDCPNQLVTLGDGKEVHDLTAKWGVYNNFSILLRADFATVKGYFSDSKSFSDHHSKISSDVIFDWNEGPIQVWFWPEINPFYLTPGSEGDQRRQRENYTFPLGLSFRDEFSLQDIPYSAKVIGLISEEIIKRHRIPACFPKSIGLNHKNDFSRVVYVEY